MKNIYIYIYSEKMEEIKKNIRTWGCGASRFRVMAL